jgi:ferredoxin
MRVERPIVAIDEEKCNGCARCITACTEGALRLVDGKARLTGEVLCDGLGACIGECPTGALTIVSRVAEEFDAESVKGPERHGPKGPAGIEAAACRCPSGISMTLDVRMPGGRTGRTAPGPSMLGHWPVKLALLNPDAPFLKGSDLVLLADCCAVATPDLHDRFLGARTIAMACPKLDDTDRHVERLAEIISRAGPRSITVVRMEVPCCRGLEMAAARAVKLAGVTVGLNAVVIARTGGVVAEGQIPLAKEASPRV